MLIPRVRRWAAMAAALPLLALVGCDNPPASTLQRPADPVVLTGVALPPVPNVRPGEVVAFRRSGSAWHQIPVQVDERHVANLGVVHNQPPEAQSDYLVYSDPGTLTGPDPIPTIDRDDEIVFMAVDAGGRAAGGTADPSGVVPDSGFEVKVTDTGDGDRTGYAYLFRKALGSSLDPAAGRDYVRYSFDLLTDRNGDGDSEYPEDYRFDGRGSVIGDPPTNPAPNANPENSIVHTSAYATHFDDRWREDELRITTPGSTGVDIVDRHKVFASIGPDDPGPEYPDSCVRTENTGAAGHGAFVTNIDGPVRAIRDYLGFNSGKYTERRHVYYAQRQDTTTFLRVHPLPNGPDDTFDYTDLATGMTYRNDRNTGGVTIDGQPDAMTPGELRWEQVTGNQGTVTHVHRIEIVPARAGAPLPLISSFYVDDATPLPEFVQCTGNSKAMATSGPAILPPGTADTDPHDRGGVGHDYDLTSHRTQYYDPPNQGLAEARQRDRWANQPPDVAFSAWTG